MNNKSFEIQNQIRQTAVQTHENIKNLKKWEDEMKEKELETKKQLELEQSSSQNQVRSSFSEIYRLINNLVFLP